MAGSILPDYSPSDPTGYESPVPDRLMDSAEQFITLFHQENNLGSPDHRIRQVRREIEFSGSYWHTPAELTFGARVAWRNSSRCIGRLYWHSLRVRDRREISSAADIAAESVTHLRTATNDGRIRPLITVFAPDAPGQPGPRIISSQLIRYAGYDLVGGGVVGDPANVALTRLARELGWTGGRPPGRFDVLPLLVQEAGGPVTMHEVPPDAVLEVGIEHPEYRWFANLGLRWYAVPVISSMYLDVGGVRYPAAPFNGWYMGTEIGSRDFGDAGRYDELREIAAHLGLSTATDRNLWKDKALTELNLAVLHSFDAAGVSITDHHTESARFLQHLQREERHGRGCPVDWSWIVPPAASSATPVFHRTYADFDQTPNFYHHPDPVAAPLPPTQFPPTQLTQPPLTQSPLPQPPLEQATLTPASLTPPALTPASPGLREFAQPTDEPAALCPHQSGPHQSGPHPSGEHVPHLRMIEEQDGVEKQLT
ncbi:MAG TPA: nitric oxide synthase oxygenase [Streptosporangiaceae bacterium]|jgi:nitric-oxide synthase